MALRQMTSLIAACVLAAPVMAFAQQGRAEDRRQDDRILAMDRNHDGVVTRQEWTGTEEAFEARDWNEDGILSGAELRPGARRGQARRARGADRDSRDDQFEDWTAQGFAAIDRNRDGRITRDEWTYDRDSFDRADHNGDGVVTRAEFLNEDTRSTQEYDGRGEPPSDLFESVDTNHDGQITLSEWRWSRDSFNQRDRNRDGRLSRTEFGSSTPQNQSRAYQAGYERGRTEGLHAGREDRERNQGWDLDGQRELETADSGYTPSLGSRAEYQAGYRDGFRAAYPEGYGR